MIAEEYKDFKVTRLPAAVPEGNIVGPYPRGTAENLQKRIDRRASDNYIFHRDLTLGGELHVAVLSGAVEEYYEERKGRLGRLLEEWVKVTEEAREREGGHNG